MQVQYKSTTDKLTSTLQAQNNWTSLCAASIVKDYNCVELIFDLSHAKKCMFLRFWRAKLQSTICYLLSTLIENVTITLNGKNNKDF